MDVVFAAAIVAWLAWTNRRGLRWFLPAPILAGVALIAYNLWFFDTILGGQARLEQFHSENARRVGHMVRQPGRRVARNPDEP